MERPSASISQSSRASRWRRWRGIGRSLVIYYGNPFKLRRMAQFYAQFIGRGALCFDIGAHVGNRTWVWTRLGAKVVAVEPQEACLTLLQRWYGDSSQVILVDQAVGAAPGSQTLRISRAHPTVTTLSSTWIEAVQTTESFAQVEWEETATVAVTTLDALIAQYGRPVFCKIDIEGYEGEALAGLSQALPVLSFEYVPPAKQAALACLDRLRQLGAYEYNWSLGEQHKWQSPRWLAHAEMAAFLEGLAPDDPSGDVYARLADSASTAFESAHP